MRYQKLGNTGLFVSELCLGTMTFGGEEGMWGKIGQLRQAEAEQLVGSALDAGINFIDTANVYSEGRSEEITGQALKNLKIPRENVVVATKVFGETGTAGVNSRGSSRYHIMGSVKESLRRLQLDHIDLYQLPLRSGDADRRDAIGPGYPGTAGACALHRCFKLGGLANRQSAGHRGTPWTLALCFSAGLLHDCRA